MKRKPLKPKTTKRFKWRGYFVPMIIAEKERVLGLDGLSLLNKERRRYQIR